MSIAAQKEKQLAPDSSPDDDLPEGWTVEPLGNLVSPSKEKIEPDQKPDAPYLSLEHVESKVMRIIGHGFGRDVKSTKTIFRTGDVLYGKLRPYLNKVCIPDFDGICSTDFLVFQRVPWIENRLLLWFLSRPEVVDIANHHSTGVELPRVNFQTLASLSFPLPPASEQKRIVAKIEELFVQVNAARARLAKVPLILKSFRQAVLAAACSGRLTEDWREKHSNLEPASEFLERIAQDRRKERESPSERSRPQLNIKVDSDLPELSGLWCWATINQVADVRGGIQKQPKRTPKQNAYPYLRVANVLRGKLDLAEIHKMELFEGELETYRLQPNDLLVVEGNGSLSEIGRSAIWSGEIDDCVHQNHIIRVRARICSTAYLNAYWNSPIGTARIAELAVTTAGLYNLSTQKVSSMPVPLPPLEEQNEIVRRVEALFKLADSIEKRLQAATKRADKLIQAILAKAFRGELVPTEADLARREGREYESAADLLARIKAERERSTAVDGIRVRRKRAARRK
jgi:type I restriction enzyme, S subunit